MTAEQRITKAILNLQADKDRSKPLSIYALLKCDSGAEYSEDDYSRAIEWIKAGTERKGDTADGFMQEGIEWLKAHLGQA